MAHEVGFIGLGRMGSNMALNLLGRNYKVIGYDKDQEVIKRLEIQGMIKADSLKDLTNKLTKPRVN